LPALLLLIALPVAAQEKDPDEDALFGGDDSDEPIISDQKLAEEDDKLQIGGLLYMQSMWTFTEGSDLSDHPISLPNLLEIYLDGRPSDRLRGYIRGRMLWIPSLALDPPLSALGSEIFVPMLDQMWLKFDIARRVYVTVGKQAVRWGATRLWNPVDVINSTRRDPLALFDFRTGVPVLKLHMPVESLGWNFYVLGMMDQVDSLDKAGVAARAEFVISTWELGLTGAWRDEVDPRVGLDLSAGIWEFDVTSELGVGFDEDDDHAPKVQVTGGLQYGVKYTDEDVMYFGLEYFYNPDAAAEAQFLYAGEHYGAFVMLLPGPGNWDHTNFTLSLLGNFSDNSFAARLDYSTRALTFMTVQAFITGHFGDEGELRPTTELNPNLPDTQVIDIGLNLRIDL